MTKKRILVIAGPTGVGESSITNKIIKKYPLFTRLVTATTRAPRLKEKNKVDYYFFAKKKFKEEIAKKNILEHTYIKSRDVYYGTYKKDLDKKIKQNLNIIVNPDIVGAKYFKKNYNATTIFIMPESIDDLRKRQLKRNPDITKTELNKRLKYAEYEIENESYFYDYKVMNKEGKLNQAVLEVKKIIKKEKYNLI
ncbi:hypothetical protein DRH27_01865 [Candidatus Falkowbacteria bacterium]|nr:MAG: hypothetical protein DRH27_01865 [Candidatus Falkowbacteria bacterium]